MPLANGDIVATSRNLAAHMQSQPPRFGTVEDATGIDVLWEDGTFTQGITTNTSLDVIRFSATAVLSEGKVVRVGNNPATAANANAPPPFTGVQPSPSFDAVVVNTYRREAGGDGSVSSDLVLVRLLSNGAYLEVYATQVARRDDR